MDQNRTQMERDGGQYSPEGERGERDGALIVLANLR